MVPWAILPRFALPGEVTDCVPYGDGHVNQTFLISTSQGRYILQHISDRAFPDVPAVMENISAVTAFLRQKDPRPRHSLHLVRTTDGAGFYRDRGGKYWRMSAFIEGARAPMAGEFREVGAAWGQFLQQMSDYPGTLRESIPRFHDTPHRFRLFHEAIEADPDGRVREVGAEIDFFLEREAKAGRLEAMKAAGELPVRITHNDTKADNLLLDAATGEMLCVLDLDTVMPGLAAYDFGDAIRSGSLAGGRKALDTDMLAAFASGFLDACPILTAPERETLSLGVWTMTLECGLRYLTDYLDGGRYFAARIPDRRMERVHVHQRLLLDMERRRSELDAAIKSLI